MSDHQVSSDNNSDNSIANKTVNIVIEDCVIHLSGQVNRYTVPELIAGIDINLLCKEQFIIDFSAVSQVDTAGLAWILKIMGQGRQSGQAVKLRGIPSQLTNLARISDVDNLLSPA